MPFSLTRTYTFIFPWLCEFHHYFNCVCECVCGGVPTMAREGVRYLEFHAVVSCPMQVLRIKLWSSAKAVCDINCQPISSDPTHEYSLFVCLLLSWLVDLVWFLKTGFPWVALAVLELTLQTESCPLIQKSTCLGLPSVGIQGMCHHNWQPMSTLTWSQKVVLT